MMTAKVPVEALSGGLGINYRNFTKSLPNRLDKPVEKW